MIDTVAIKIVEKATIILTLSLIFKDDYQLNYWKQQLINISEMIFKANLTFLVEK